MAIDAFNRRQNETLETALHGLRHGVCVARRAGTGLSHQADTIVVAYPAGQGTDIAARYLGNQLAKDLGQPIVIDNRPGAGGNLGTELAARHRPTATRSPWAPTPPMW